ncbi:MAG: hypothetical protein IPH84_13645 [Bacteroidales bacterium]|nr:hypothetical protein [Bacteroidales bacterium]
MTDNTQLPEKKSLIAKTIAGLEEVLARELQELGAEDVEILNRAVRFSGDERMVYKTNFCSRTALRILVPLFDFQLADEDDLYGQFFNYPWEEIMNVTSTLAIDAVVSDSELTHSHYVSLRAKDAIVDRFREQFNGRRPSVDIDDPDFRINIHILGSTCDVSLDSSGASLHKRGYRVSNAEAPMSEVLAAGLIMLSGWDKKSHFIDPMCGSGTLLIEAALIANNFPPGMYRKSFGFMRWKNFNSELWEEVKQEAHDQETEFEYQIIGNDISPKNLGTAKANVKSARLHKDIHLKLGPFSELMPPEGEPGVVVINPPYGERIKTGDIIGLYREIGDNLKKNFAGYHAWVISSDHYALKSVGLRAIRKDIVWNGPLECRFAGFDLYVGTKKTWIRDEHQHELDTEKTEGTDAPEDPGTEGTTEVKRRVSSNTGNEPENEGGNIEKPFRRREEGEERRSPRGTGSERPERPYRRDDRPSERNERGSRSPRNDSHGDRPVRRDRDNDKPFERKDGPSRPYQRDRNDSNGDRPVRRERDNNRPFERKDGPSRPYQRDRNDSNGDRPVRRDRDNDRPFERKDGPSRPYQRDRNDSNGDRPVRRDRDNERPFERKDRPSRPFQKDRNESSGDRPFRRDKDNDRPFERKERSSKPFHNDRNDNSGDRPVRRERKEGDGDRPFSRDRKSDSPFKPYGKSRDENRPPRRDKDSDRPYQKKDRPDRPYSSERDKDRTDRPRKYDDRTDKPYSSRGKDAPPPGEKKEIEVYQPQNRFSKPEKTYRRSDGKVNEGDPSGSKEKPKKESRPRKPRKDED